MPGASTLKSFNITRMLSRQIAFNLLLTQDQRHFVDAPDRNQTWAIKEVKPVDATSSIVVIYNITAKAYLVPNEGRSALLPATPFPPFASRCIKTIAA